MVYVVSLFSIVSFRCQNNAMIIFSGKDMDNVNSSYTPTLPVQSLVHNELSIAEQIVLLGVASRVSRALPGAGIGAVLSMVSAGICCEVEEV